MSEKVLIYNWMDIKNPKAGGQEKYCYEIGRRLARDGYNVTWISSAFPGSNARENFEGISIIRIGSIYTVFIRSFFDYLSRDKNSKVFLSINAIPFFIPTGGRKRLIMLHHKIELKTMVQKIGPLGVIGYILQNFVSPRIFRRDRIITNSSSSKEEFEMLGYKNVKVVKLGVDLPLVDFEKKKDIVISPGPVKPWKHHDLVIEAFSRLGDEWKLIVFGSYENERYKEYLEELVQKKEISDRVVFLGRIGDEELKNVYKSAKICLLATEKEGWGFVAMEAQANGCPVVAFNVPGIRDSVKDGETGVLVKYGDVSALGNALVKLASDRFLLEKFSKGAVDWSRLFDWESCYRDFVAQLKCIE